MPVPILMPALSPTMEEGKLARWLVKEGDSVTSGDIVAEIETDKATMEVEAVDEGTVGRIAVPEGTDGVKVNTPIAILLAEGEDADQIDAVNEVAATSGAVPAPAIDSPEKSGAATPVAAPVDNKATDRVFASPLARRLAEKAGIEIASVAGTGPRGRVVQRDIEATIATRSKAPGVAPTAVSLAETPDTEAVKSRYEEESYEEIPLDAMRAIIARRLTEAKQTIPHFYLTVEVDLDALLATRARANATLAGQSVKLSVNDYAIKASALALRDVPDCNVAFAGDRLLRFHSVDVAVAVAIEGGLFTPVIRAAETLSLTEISRRMKDLAERARTRRLDPAEYQGGSFTLSNLGMYGIRNFDAVINPPHGSILALGAGEARAVVRDGEIRTATRMSATLSVDHRAIDGALGARFLKAFRSYLEDPALMAV